MHNDTLTTYTAAGAITSPVWLPYLHQISVVAAELAPIVGVLWLLIRIYISIHEHMQDKAKPKDCNDRNR